MAPRRLPPPRRILGIALLLALPWAAPAALEAAPKGAVVVVVLGTDPDARRFEAALEGTRAAARLLEPAFEVRAFDDQGTSRGLKAALSRARREKPAGWIVAPSSGLADAYWKAVKRLKAPVFVLDVLAPDRSRNRGNVWHLNPSPAAEAVEAADTMLAPLAARRVAVVHEPSARGRTLASGFARSLSRFVTLAGVLEWREEEGVDAAVEALKTFEADWIYAAVSGNTAVSFVDAVASGKIPRRVLFCDGNRAESLVERGGVMLEGSVFLDGPDPELHGRLGEDLITELEKTGAPVDVQALRAFEAARRIVQAVKRADSTSGAKVQAAVEACASEPGVLGRLAFEPYRGVRLYPYALWRIRKDRLESWNDDLLPTLGCGPPLGFGRPPPAEVNEKRGRLGYMTYGAGETRTIEQDLLELGLSTGGREPDLDQAVRDEILYRAIRIAHRLFRRETDGSAIPGHSWGLTFTVEEPPNDVPRSRIWKAIVAGDHAAAGGQVIGSGLVAVYSTFLKRTMYLQRKLEPPLSAADRPLLDGTYRWGEDRTLNFRANKLRCLLDGFSSAVGLTTAHEFGHLCGCGHDTEHPTSIMNVVAGAGASWEDAVWIPSHEKGVTTTLGIDGS